MTAAAAFDTVLARVPFPVLEVHPDNCGEFFNGLMATAASTWYPYAKGFLALIGRIGLVLAEKCHALRDLPVSPNHPKWLSIQGDGYSNACAFAASMGTPTHFSDG